MTATQSNNLTGVYQEGKTLIQAARPNTAVDHPAHYNTLPAVCNKCGDPIECIEVVRHLDFNTGNAIKYIWRAKHKGNTIEDLQKAVWYLQDEIEYLQKEKTTQK